MEHNKRILTYEYKVKKGIFVIVRIPEWCRRRKSQHGRR